MEQFKIVAKTLAGLEEILAQEIEKIGGTNIAIGTRMVSYEGDKALLYKSNLWLRTALRVLKPIESFQAADPDELYQQVKSIDWTKYIAEGQTIAIDNTIFSENFRNSRYAIYRAKDAICDFFVEKGMKRPKISIASADVQLNLHITDDECLFSLDSSGDPLYKRGYKEQLTDAPISEVLAAGILLKAGWDGQRDLYDPMCGSGTFLVEAALIATNTPAGIYRQSFGFERWSVGENAFDEELWQSLYDDDSQQRDFEFMIFGSDISKVAIDATTQNVKAAGLSKYISLEVKDFEDVKEAPKSEHTAQLLAEGQQAPGCMLVTNPPYGKRLFTDVPTFYRMMGSVLKKSFQGSEAWIISSDDSTFTFIDPKSGYRKEGEAFDFIGLKASIKIDLNNGGIACQLRKYELFSGRFEDFRAEGKELDKKSADEKEESKFERIRHDRKPSRKDGEKKDFKKKDGDRRSKKDDKPKRTKGSSSERAYTVRKDGSIVAGKSTDDGEKSFDGEKKPFEKKAFDKKKPFAKKDGDRKPFRKDGDKKDFKKKDGDKKPFAVTSGRGNFKRNAEGKYEEREGGNYQPRGKREFDPNRPMFGKDFDMSKAVLDYSKPSEDKKKED